MVPLIDLENTKKGKEPYAIFINICPKVVYLIGLKALLFWFLIGSFLGSLLALEDI